MKNSIITIAILLIVVAMSSKYASAQSGEAVESTLAADATTQESVESLESPLAADATAQESVEAVESPLITDAAAEESVEAEESPLATEAAAEQVGMQPMASQPTVAPAAETGQLVFNFSGTGWQDVLEWFAEMADLSLQIDRYPAGTISFADPSRSYSVDESLDILNRLLLDRGYALVRRGRMLLLIDLEVDNAANLISEMAELVLLEELDGRSRSDIVSCVFPLGSLTPDSAREELAQLIGPWGRVIVLDSARQVKVTETVSKLLAIRQLLENAKQAESSVVEIILTNRGADEMLELARPLIGLEPGANSDESIRIAVGLYGERIYATGLPGKVSLLESIIEKADKPLATSDADAGNEVILPVFQTHSVTQADSSTVFDVLQTLLAGTPDARIAVDPKTNAIVSYARPETQALISETIAKLEGNGQDFKIINLKRLDPAQALLTINKFFGVTEEGGQGPTIDGDPVTNRLWVRGTTEQIKMVEQLIGELEGDDLLGALSDKVRVLPYTGQPAADALQQVQDVWSVLGRGNQIRTISPSSGGGMRGGMPDRRVHPRPEPNQTNGPATQPDKPTSPDQPDFARRPTSEVANPFREQHLVTTQVGELASVTDSADTDSNRAAAPQSDPPSIKLDFQGADIVVQFSPAGMIVASEDTEALDAFESLMQSFASQSAMSNSLPTIFWLKYAKADVTAELVSSILGGGESSLSSMTDSISSGLGGIGGGMLGLLGVGGGGGSDSSAKSVLTATGSVSIVPDARLNALIVQANPIDLELVELILQKIDIQESPEDVEVVAKPALIPVIYQDAKDVAEVVKSVFADRMQEASNSRSGGGGGGGGQPSPQELIAALRGGGGRGGGKQAAESEPSKITVAVDVRSNSLVVTATPQDFEEVRQLVIALDEGGMQSEESVEVVTLKGNIKADVVRQALESVLGTTVKSTSGASSGASSSSSGGSTPAASGAPSSDEIRRRIEMFRSMQAGGGGAPGGFGGRGGGATTSGRGGGGGGAPSGRGGGAPGGRGGR
ncbi:secretin N-terminal domain-containing protein [Novipirellula artificiosorum]|uniref:Bacterial type II/III secretion system short domain protein n=1 Tax=Novipirellula artificiosorum TaxID=2528016 RepID=A0A5C6DEG1_9BACT|nr:secretin N-terminal domain-containing protein [Novipirellula artificiosorum]TWU35112.1 Bacterial type II/III secretion system short domain protein [Novipirellula artificiosorum]